ncbi:MAG: hypothetical protein NPIRA04_32560 [Nitrospirales bacterium]|nr:MAG: hypothetical protein NPIRA04_32560 [Nitrospirales bacterium]
MHYSSIRFFCFLSFTLGFWFATPILAEAQDRNSVKQESTEKDSESLSSPERKLPQRPVPFAHFEESLKNSEHWKTLSPEEQEETLENIRLQRKRFFQREVERQKQYRSLLEDSEKKSSRSSRRNREPVE